MIVIRDIRESDRAEWAPLFLAYGVFYETEFTTQIVDAVFDRLVSDAPDIRGFIAELDGRVVGFALYRPLFDTFTAATSWFLDDLFVDPAARGHGAATALIEAVAGAARDNGGGAVRWFTGENNETAQTIYNRVATRKPWFTYEMEQ